MKLRTNTKWKNLDFGIIIPGFFLVLISIVTLYSLELNQEIRDFSLLKTQALSAFIGIMIFVGFLYFDFRTLKDYAYILFFVGLLALLLVLIFGVTIRGTTGWFSISRFTFQPVELFKIFLILASAKFFSRIQNINQTKQLLFSFFLIIPPAILIYLQPDVGSLLVLFVVWAGFLFIVKLRPIYIILFIIVAVLGLLLSWQFLFETYQKERISTFLNPGSDLIGAGYNVTQSKIAIGSGRLLGRGLGLGTQSSLNFLPEQETDFIFAVISESLGFLGSGLVIFLYTFLLWRILNLSMAMRDEFGALILIGIFFWFAFQGFSNIAMNLGLAPVFGVPLPLVSYGGSSLLVSITALGLTQSISLYSPSESSD